MAHDTPSRLKMETDSELIPGYRLRRWLGRGGHGDVWEAQGPDMKMVALKILPLSGERTPAEQTALALLRDIPHPNLLPIFETWTLSDHLIIAMELADRTLAERLKEAKSQGASGLSAEEVLGYLEEAARGIDHLNTCQHAGRASPSVPLEGATEELAFFDMRLGGIQHRDIKPQNLFLVRGRVKVADFGLAKFLEHTITSHTGGMTPSYAAPEFFQGRTAPQSDQYSLAVTYCQLRGGRLPFEGTPAQVMAGHLMNAPDLSMLSEKERDVVNRALAKNPIDRWTSCVEFMAALRSGISLGNPNAPRIKSPGPPPFLGTKPSKLLTPGKASAPVVPEVVLTPASLSPAKSRNSVRIAAALLVFCVLITSCVTWNIFDRKRGSFPFDARADAGKAALPSKEWTEYYPLEVGNTWHTNGYWTLKGRETEIRAIQRVKAIHKRGPVKLVELETQSGWDGKSIETLWLRQSSEGLFYSFKDGALGSCLLPSPVTIGEKWKAITTAGLVEVVAIEEVIVPAGKFRAARVEGNGITTWFAAGVGPIKSINRFPDGQFISVLTKFERNITLTPLPDEVFKKVITP